jgi:hypothetical protein
MSRRVEERFIWKRSSTVSDSRPWAATSVTADLNPVQSGIYSGMLNTDTIQITPELLALLSEIDEFKGTWRALETMVPERLNALYRYRQARPSPLNSSTHVDQ